MAQVGVLQTRPTRQKHRQGALSCAWGRAALGRAKPQQPPIGLRTGAVGGTDGAAAPTPLCVGWCRGWAKPDPAPTGAWKRAAGSPRPGCQRAFQLDTNALSSDSREDGPSPKRKLLDWVTLVADQHAHEEPPGCRQETTKQAHLGQERILGQMLPQALGSCGHTEKA